jgi:hypothetical protein
MLLEYLPHRLQVLAQAPSNDRCENAAIVGSFPYEKLSSTTDGATVDFALDTCGIAAAARGVWYSVTGRDKIVTASVTASSFNSEIAVFSGSCSLLSCIDSNDVNFALTSSLAFMAKAGSTYYILITGVKVADVGTYNLLISVRRS